MKAFQQAISEGNILAAEAALAKIEAEKFHPNMAVIKAQQSTATAAAVVAMYAQVEGQNANLVGSGDIYDFLWGAGTVPYDGDAYWGSNFIGPGPDGNPDPRTLTDNNGNLLQPKDLIDAFARSHDIEYFEANATGAKDAFFNTRVADADIRLVRGSMEVMEGFFLGKIDPYTNQPISQRKYYMANAVYNLFAPVCIYKKLFE